MSTWYESAEEQLDNDLRDGLITQVEYRKAMREIRDEMRGQAEEAAERAYNDAMGTW